MKTYLALLAAVALAACGGGGSNDGGAKTAAQAAPASETPAASTPAATTPAASTPAATTAPTDTSNSAPTTQPDTPATTKPDTPTTGNTSSADTSTPASSTDSASAPGGASTPLITTCEAGYTTDPAQVCNGNGVSKYYAYVVPKTIIPSNTIIGKNTTWTAVDSPYLVGTNVKVAANATLTIEGGAIVGSQRYAPCTGCSSVGGFGSLSVDGYVDIRGTADKRAKLLGISLSNGQTGSISLQFADLFESALPYGGSSKLVLLDSRIERANVNSIVSADGVVTYSSNNFSSVPPNSDIERNTFINSAGVQFDNSVTIKNNLFIDMASPLVLSNVGTTGTFDQTTNTWSYSWSKTLVTLNSFLFKVGTNNPNQLALSMLPNAGNCPSSSTCTQFEFDVSNNYWGTDSGTVIYSHYADSTNNPSLHGKITYTPVLDKPDALTPVDTTKLANQ